TRRIRAPARRRRAARGRRRRRGAARAQGEGKTACAPSIRDRRRAGARRAAVIDYAPLDMTTAATPRAPLTVRALIAGFLLALVLCGVNSYLTLSFGVIEEGPTIAALFFFAFFFLSATKITTTEMGIVATMGSAGGSLGFITNFFAAQAMVGAPYSFWQMAGFAVVTSLVGMAFVVPLRQMLILREELPWPAARATESVIRALVDKGDPKQPFYLLVTPLACIGLVVA